MKPSKLEKSIMEVADFIYDVAVAAPIIIFMAVLFIFIAFLSQMFNN